MKYTIIQNQLLDPELEIYSNSKLETYNNKSDALEALNDYNRYNDDYYTEYYIKTSNNYIINK